MLYVAASVIILILIIFNLFVIILKNKILILESILFDLFKRRNYQVSSVYFISEKYLTRHRDVFSEFLKLKRRDFSENSYDLRLDWKIATYKKIHNEINFIFKVCDKHNDLKKNAIYNYIKESIMEKSEVIWDKYSLYKKISEKYKKLLFISKFTLIGFLIWE